MTLQGCWGLKISALETNTWPVALFHFTFFIFVIPSFFPLPMCGSFTVRFDRGSTWVHAYIYYGGLRFSHSIVADRFVLCSFSGSGPLWSRRETADALDKCYLGFAFWCVRQRSREKEGVRVVCYERDGLWCWIRGWGLLRFHSNARCMYLKEQKNQRIAPLTDRHITRSPVRLLEVDEANSDLIFLSLFCLVHNF